MAGQSSTVEQKTARIASRAHGVVTRGELLQAGITKAEIDHRMATGALILVHRGVYRVGHAAPSVEARYMAAVKACGERAVLSGLAAAYLLGLLRGSKPPAAEVTAPTWRRVDGVATHRSRSFERMTFKGIPVTTAARTLVDIAPYLSDAELAVACHQAGVRHKTTPRHLQQTLQRKPNAPAAAKLRRIMRGETPTSLSALERRFLARLREANLPLPDQTNRRADTKRVDCRWTEHKLTVELDSYTFHNSSYSWEQDRKRERETYARGDQFRRYTWGDVFNHPAQMLKELRDLLPA